MCKLKANVVQEKSNFNLLYPLKTILVACRPVVSQIERSDTNFTGLRSVDLHGIKPCMLTCLCLSAH